MPSISEVYMTLRVDRSRVKQDAEAGLSGVDGTSAGRKVGDSFGQGFNRGVDGRLRDSRGKFVKDSDAVSEGGRVGKLFGDSFGKQMSLSISGHLKSIASGIGPGILGVGAGTASKVAGGGVALGALPALLAGVAPLALAGVGAGASGALFASLQAQIKPVSDALSKAQAAKSAATTPQEAQAANVQLAAANKLAQQLNPALRQIMGSEKQISDAWQKFSTGLAPLFVGPVKQVAATFTQLTTPLKSFFAGATGIITPLIGGLGDIAKDALPGITSALKAATPAIRPLLDGFGQLAKGLLPGLVSLLHSAMPAVTVLAQALGQLGKGLGGVLASFAPVVGASSVILKALLGIVTALLPVVGSLVQVFATQLAPVFKTFAGVIVSLLPFITTVGKVLADLAGAVLTDLSSAFGALVTLLKAAAGPLGVFAKALGNVFTLLENSGVFAVIGNAIENLAGPLGKLVSTLLVGLAPLLPPIIGFLGNLASLLATTLSNAVLKLIPPLNQLASQVIAALVGLLPVLIPLFNAIVGALSPAFVAVVAALAFALNDIISALPPSVLQAVVVAIAAVVAGIKLWALAQAILNIALDANPIGAIIIGIAALVVGVVELVKNWGTVWGAIKRAAQDAWSFIWNGFGKFLLPLLGPVGLIALGVIEVYQHWSQILGFIKRAASDAWSFIWSGFGKFLLPLLGPAGLLALGVLEVYQHWQSILNALKRFIVADFVAPVTNTLLSFISFLLHGVASAFGWIPGLGGQLRTAASSFDKFRQQVNDSLAKITSSVNVNLTTSGTGSIIITGTGINTRTINTKTGQVSGGGGHTAAQGLLVPGPGGPTEDNHLAYVSTGELIVPTSMVSAGLVDHLRGSIPGFSGGGVVGSPGWAGGPATAKGGVVGAEAAWGQLAAAAFAQATLDAAKKAQQSFTGGVSLAGLSGSSGYQAFQSVAQRLGWAGSLFTDWVNVEMREAGFSLTAQNPTSGAYGMAQFINGAGEYAQWGGNASTYIGQAVAMANYIRSRYGNPSNAWAHEQAFNWYDNGGVVSEPVIGLGLRSGQRYGFAMNGVPETVTPGTGSGRQVVINLGGVIVREEADIDLIAQKIGFAVGGGGL